VRAAPEQADAGEIVTCKSTYFGPALAVLPKVRLLVALGQIAHGAAGRAAGGRLSQYRFGHLTEHRLPDGRLLIDSYHRTMSKTVAVDASGDKAGARG
jgi:uracil-DNA glycosylase